MSQKKPAKTASYEICRYFIPASLTASQTHEAKRKRATGRTLSTPLTYKSLFEIQERKVQLQDINPQTAANRATALRGFLRANGLHPDDIVGDEMRMRHPDALVRYTSMMKEDERSNRAISNTLAAFRPWREYVIEHDTLVAINAEKPTPFLEALKSLLINRCTTRVAKEAGLSKHMLFGWLNGKVPRGSNAKYLIRLETYFGLEANSLVLLSGMKLKGTRRESIGGMPAPIEYRNILGDLTRIIFAVKPKPDSPLRGQWADLLLYKTAAAPKFKRTKRGQWRISPCPLTAQTDSNWWAFSVGREVASARMSWANTSSYLGWLRLSNASGGMSIVEDEVETLAWLAVPDHLESYLDWTKARVGKRSRGTTQFLAYIASLVRPRFGYLRQRPEMRDTLPAMYRDESWDELCQRQFDLCEQLTASYQCEIEVSRDSFEPIKHIINMTQPMDAVADMIQRMRADRPVGCVRREATWSRDLVLIKILSSNALRRRNLAHLTWRADNTGELHQREDKSWWIRISKRKFKNTMGAAGDFDYDSPVNPSAWPDIEKYLRIYRPMLLRSPTDLVFLTQLCRRKEHYPWIDLGSTVSTLTAKYLSRCFGVGPHAFRHMVATSILKADGGDIKTAALVLNDRMHTVEKHYAGIRSGDGAKRMAELLDSSFSRM